MESAKKYKIKKKGLDNYQITKNGKIYSNHGKGRWLSTNKHNGYQSVCMMNTCDKKRCTYNIHRLVALTFIDNPHNYKIVDHINGDKLDNNMENLQWTTQKHNVNKSTKTTSHPKQINQIDRKTKKIIKTFDSIAIAAKELGHERTKFNKWVTGRNRCTDPDYIFKYAHDYNRPVAFDTSKGKQIKKYPRYYVTKDGNVYSQKNMAGTLFLKLQKCKNNDDDGYEVVTIKKDPIYQPRINRLVAEYYLENFDESKIVIHINGIKNDNRVENLKCV